ncbi:MAG: hypothetical protein A3H17_00045 [Candidatus Levybacteria bacterium RIFCSPLOWO2_12_FULL_37_14]|nr:MAG: Micrococcal nuclease [Candidatus Levybacteria bacterium GW2011_GWA1_37_16]KKQ37240.1 MAG: Micrococcal nuclease [Candidatus Levybacteria bacterium GW2011_GWC2_37_7]KKQ42363.1 MAG: Micrococcal nuclease [Candidatus Levybacteria bacterium GW2011_GWB1_37_8]OGH51312.1 MAG: hypothetical protein A3H17_00045 [Candidatus Levybacteria bacterium RIFCSPLOWO2_12_FULL_37_14]
MKNRKILTHIVFVVLAGVFVLLNNSGLNSGLKQNKIILPSPTNKQIFSSKETVRVIRVVDGDTIEVNLNGKKETVRLIGIDSPEVLDERKPAQCFGKEASSKAKEILTGKTIILESDSTQGNRDEYGRLLRYVFLNDLNLNKFIISEGYAREYTFKDNPYRYQSDFIQAEKKARKNKMGLWLGCELGLNTTFYA